MLRFTLLIVLFVANVSCYPRHEEEEARVLSEVWEAMDKHRGDDIIVIPRHDGPGSGPEHHSGPDHRSSSDHHHHSPSHDGPSHDRSSESERSSSRETETTSESSEKSDSSSAESSDTSANESSSSAKLTSERFEGEESSSSSRGHEHDSPSEESSYDRMWSKFNRMGDMMNRAVERLRKDDREIEELENQSSGGATVFILEIVGAVVVGLILVGLLIFGFVKGLKGIKTWKARRQSERLVDQEAPNMDGTGYQSGYNP